MEFKTPLEDKNLDTLLQSMIDIAQQIELGEEPIIEEQAVRFFRTAIRSFKELKCSHWFKRKYAITTPTPIQALRIIEEYYQN